MVKLNKTDEQVINALKTSATGLTLQEITEKTGEPSKKIFKSLRKLFEKELIDAKAHKYKLLNPNKTNQKPKENTEETETPQK